MLRYSRHLPRYFVRFYLPFDGYIIVNSFIMGNNSSILGGLVGGIASAAGSAISSAAKVASSGISAAS